MMRIIRSLLSGFCFSIFGIGGFIIGTFLFPIIVIFTGKRHRKILVTVIHYVWRLFVWIMSITRLISVKISLDDLNKLHQTKGCVVVANHPSLIDVVILISLIPNSVCVVKGKLVRNFFIGSIIRLVYIANDGDVVHFMDECDKLLKAGFNVIIFPEGTRTKLGDSEHQLHRGFAQLALHSGADILPVVVKCCPQVLGKGQSWWDVGDKVSIFSLRVLDRIYLENSVLEKPGFHEKAKKITDFVRKVLFS